MKRLLAPGCALMLYKPHLAEKLHAFLNKRDRRVAMHLTCCRHVPPLPSGAEVINVCPGCDRRYRENYKDSSTVSFWELIAKNSSFPFPDYSGCKMTIIDACPTRDQTRVHDAVREVIRRMNIRLVEPRQTRTRSTCCGDSFWGTIPTKRVVTLMKKRASEMPAEDVIVYCISCTKAMFIGGKRPRYLLDLLFQEETVPKTYEPDQWHKELDEHVNSHT